MCVHIPWDTHSKECPREQKRSVKVGLDVSHDLSLNGSSFKLNWLGRYTKD